LVAFFDFNFLIFHEFSILHASSILKSSGSMPSINSGVRGGVPAGGLPAGIRGRVQQLFVRVLIHPHGFVQKGPIYGEYQIQTCLS